MTLEQAALKHNINPEDLVNEINKIILDPLLTGLPQGNYILLVEATDKQ